MESTPLFWTVIGILTAQFLLDTLLDYLNFKRFNTHVPPEVRDVYDADNHQKSLAYKKANHTFGIYNESCSFLLTLLFLCFGGFDWLDGWLRTFLENPIGLALAFFGILMLGSSVLSLPFSYYRTFVIEEKFGFNKTTLKTFVLDLLKGWLLTAVLGGGILALVIWLVQQLGPNFWWYAWALFSVLMICINFCYTKLIVPLFNTLSPLEEGKLKKAIETYAERVGFELKHIFVIDGSKRSTKANAYFSGFGKQKQVTLYDTLIHDLEEQEIVAVLAHEVGHYKRRHIIFNMVTSMVLTGGTLFLFSVFVNHPELSHAIGVSKPSLHASLVGFALLYCPISTLTGLVMNYVSRQFEFQADDYAKQTFAAAPLISSLKKLSQHSLSNLSPHPAYVFFHYSHPPLVDRIRNLMV
ncbi:Ste24 endopeptidase [Croceitalea dokdonensis DOKDO 023]|uniref:Ste24 endopeptidase n=1 Tax=Croceitalea dokdonensis DOKDO 023 TaxID=1300341 RepID=A0A0N8H3G0_9FLAO|nr:M48 family metallopeptidase [Croceitalea dokdonensis]KPM30468.1 Ste24 endopeptidase [Croceitalea dokdonensis DOKDO 023]